MLFTVAAAAYVVALGLFIALHLRGNYSLLRHAVSDYAIGPTRGLFLTYGLAGGLGAALVGCGVLVQGGLPVRSGVYLLASAGVRLGVLGFSTDLEGQPVTRAGLLHLVFAIAGFALVYMAIDSLQPFARDLVTGPVRTTLVWLHTVATLSLIGVVVCLYPALRRLFGLVERAFLLSTLLWLLTFAAVMG